MKNIFFNKIIFLSFLLMIQIKGIDITLTSALTDTTNTNYEISNNKISIIADGEYKFSGSCSECQISIAKGLTTKITLNSISIDNSSTGPFVIKKNAIVNLILEGESKITDNEVEENEGLDDFEGAGIKFKKSSSLTISGSGKLIIMGNVKNGIKGAALTNLIINGGTFEITAVKNALACDNLITINDGTIIINSKSDGIKSEPDSDDTESKGSIIINGGKFTINSDNDAIQAAYELVINGGNFNIKTLNGASTTNFDKDSDSAKGIKCSTNEHENIKNILTINGGTFVLDTADDSIHSDYNLTITGGIFEISTGDDGVHADQYLILGKQNSDNSLINLKITNSLEGLEGAYVYIYSGTYNIISSDDGINSAGNTTENCGQIQGGAPNNNNIKKQRNLRGRLLQGPNSFCAIFPIYIYGGDIYVNSGADGLDANGDVIISGGNIEIWSAKTGSDGDPIDREGKLTISSGTVLAGGNQGMSPIHQSSTISQQYIYTTQSYNTNKQISITNGNTIVKTINIPKNVGYIFYTSKDTTSNYKFSEGTTSTSSQTSQNNNSPPNQIGNPNSSNNNIPPNFNNSNNNLPPNFNNNNNNLPPNFNNSNNNLPPNFNNNNNNLPPNFNNSNNNLPPNFNNSNNNLPPNQSGNQNSPNNNLPPNFNNTNNPPPGFNNSINNLPPNQSGNQYSPNNNSPPNPNSSDGLFPNDGSNPNVNPSTNPNINPNTNQIQNENGNPSSSSDDNTFIRFNFDVNLNINTLLIFIFIFVF